MPQQTKSAAVPKALGWAYDYAMCASSNCRLVNSLRPQPNLKPSVHQKHLLDVTRSNISRFAKLVGPFVDPQGTFHTHSHINAPNSVWQTRLLIAQYCMSLASVHFNDALSDPALSPTLKMKIQIANAIFGETKRTLDKMVSLWVKPFHRVQYKTLMRQFAESAVPAWERVAKEEVAEAQKFARRMAWVN